MQQQAPRYLPAPRLFSCSHIIRLAYHTSLVLCLPQADRKQNKIKQGRRKENGGAGEKPDSQYFNTREDRGGAQEKKRLENVLKSSLASGVVLLHITRLSLEQTSHKQGGLDNKNIRGQQFWRCKRYKFKRRNERKHGNEE